MVPICCAPKIPVEKHVHTFGVQPAWLLSFFVSSAPAKGAEVALAGTQRGPDNRLALNCNEMECTHFWWPASVECTMYSVLKWAFEAAPSEI